MSKETLEYVVTKAKELIAAPSCSAEAKEAAQAWIAAVGTDKQAEETKKFIAEMEEDIIPIDGLIAFAESDAGAKVFGGAEKAKGVAEHGREIKAAVVNGLANADKVLQQIKNHEAEYDFVEVMACRRGCIMGGGQPVNAGPRTRKARMKGLYDTDVNTQIKKSNENPMILSLYDTLLKGKEHELLHRNFSGK